MTTASAARQRQYRARLYAAGRHYVNGRLVDTPRVQRAPHQEPPHGTRARYIWRDDPCHCDLCRTANTEHARRWRR